MLFLKISQLVAEARGGHLQCTIAEYPAGFAARGRQELAAIQRVLFDLLQVCPARLACSEVFDREESHRHLWGFVPR